MKTVRVTLLMTLLLAGSTTRTVPTANETRPEALGAMDGPTEPECYYFNGTWICR